MAVIERSKPKGLRRYAIIESAWVKRQASAGANPVYGAQRTARVGASRQQL